MMTYVYARQGVLKRADPGNPMIDEEFKVMNAWGQDGWRFIDRRESSTHIILVFESARQERI